MQNQEIHQIISDWSDEFAESLSKSNTLCVALFGADKELLFATPLMLSLFKGEPYTSFINPTFDKLLEIKNNGSLFFEGLLTIGNYTSINSSIAAHVFFKEEKMLVIGGADTAQLLDQNTSMHHLNHQISNLQRQLLKEKHTLENTLNQLNETNSVLQQIIATKDKFFSIIAHDLRSPFNGFLGLTQMMAENLPDLTTDQIQKFSVSMQKSATNLYRLLENLLQWAQIQQGAIPFNPEVIQLRIIADESMAMIQESAKNKDIELHNDIPAGLAAFADRNMLQAVIRNLVSNAVKFTYKGGKVSISSNISSDNSIELSIKDSGIGMGPEMVDDIFKMEVKTSRKGTENEHGTGLGLVLCKEFIEKHGGKIWVESEVGKGSCFYFTLAPGA